ncbi:RND family efflux transporter, MFP subunit [Dyella jiangningensis]|uniref:efflux RND transporter periplasmic adaptor subunit n=1 Tax=Dyella sp. AtDHG13 TaxID=1938897 RepID=UPI00088FCD42|nr:efflux RND transporter periplasmic adaptor subunit [Dyella sp. AtDHG13]PXV55883.1 RND family efflux transporter MFP subunit [Dyella sp. AtDHG13]SDK52409.1 RND family efflux transporter, MFP subunit [Dyella jiangningensis]
MSFFHFVPGKSRLALAIPFIAVGAALAVGGLPRLSARTLVNRQTAALSVPTVATVMPERATGNGTLVVPGDIQAFQEANIYARTSGYLGQWFFDIGSHVHKGDLLARIDAPEVDAQLAQAQADAATASANYQIAKVTAARWQEMLKSNAVSQQSSEENVSSMKARQATLAAAQANVSRLQQLQSFEKVYAPFDGTLTVRNVDVGALIDAGNGGAPAALFRLVETDRMRVFVNVPQDDAAAIAVGAEATLALPQYPGRIFKGTVARTSGAIDPVSRTLRVEVDLPNPDGALLPGAFVQVSLSLDAGAGQVSLPANALLFRPSGVQVATVDGKNQVRLVPVTLGRDFGTRVEIRTGLHGDEKVIVNPGDAIANGQRVQVNPQPLNAA